MLDLVAAFLGGFLGSALGLAYLLHLDYLARGLANGLAWLGRGLRRLGYAVRDIFQPPPFTLPRWVQRIRERINR